MKKLTVILLGLFGLVVCANAQGQFIIDSSANAGNGSGPTATTGGLVWLDPDGILANAKLDTNVDINLMLKWGPTAASVNNLLNLDPNQFNSPASTSWLVNQPTGATDITYEGNGTIIDPNGNNYIVPGEGAGTTIYVQLYAWTGNSATFDNGTLKGVTDIFPITLEIGTAPVQPDVSGMSALVLSVPEPSLPALSALVAVVLAIFRRKN